MITMMRDIRVEKCFRVFLRIAMRFRVKNFLCKFLIREIILKYFSCTVKIFKIERKFDIIYAFPF